MVLVGGVGEVAGAADRERRPDLVRAVLGVDSCISLASSRAAGLPELTISPSMEAMSTPRPWKWLEIEPPAVIFEWSEHMHEMLSLWSWLSLVSTATTRGSILPAFRSEIPVSSKVMFLFLSSASVSALAAPPVPSPPNCVGSIFCEPELCAWSTGGAAWPCAWSTGGAAWPCAWSTGGAPACGAACGASGGGLPAPAPTSSTSWGATPESGRELAAGRSFASSLIFATASWAASAFLASGDSAAAIFAAALLAAACSGGTAASFAASAALPPFAAASSGGTAAGGAASAGAAAAAAPPPPPAAPASAAPPAPLAPFSTAGATSGASGPPDSAPRPGIAGRLTRLSTSPTALGTSSMCGSTCSPNW